MSIRRAVVATTHVDKHGERLTLSALESFAAQVRTSIIPVFFEHDPRQPPVGRTIAAEVRRRSDGEHELVLTFDLFDIDAEGNRSDEPVGIGRDREITIRNYPTDRVQVIWDRSYSSEADQELLRSLAGIGSPPMSLVMENKKAVEPVSILTIGGVFVLGSIATGLLNKIGADALDAFKRRLSQIIGKKKADTGEAVIRLQFAVSKPEETAVYDVSLFATNPDDHDIDALLNRCVRQIDTRVGQISESHPELSVLVLEYREGAIYTKYAMRRDGFPMNIDAENKEE